MLLPALLACGRGAAMGSTRDTRGQPPPCPCSAEKPIPPAVRRVASSLLGCSSKQRLLSRVPRGLAGCRAGSIFTTRWFAWGTKQKKNHLRVFALCSSSVVSGRSVLLSLCCYRQQGWLCFLERRLSSGLLAAESLKNNIKTYIYLGVTSKNRS